MSATITAPAQIAAVVTTTPAPTMETVIVERHSPVFAVAIMELATVRTRSTATVTTTMALALVPMAQTPMLNLLSATTTTALAIAVDHCTVLVMETMEDVATKALQICCTRVNVSLLPFMDVLLHLRLSLQLLLAVWLAQP